MVDKFRLEKYFQSVLSGADLPNSKPHPAVYLLSAERLGVKPAECLVIEDAAAGVAAAKAAGMYCIAYRNPNSGQQDLSGQMKSSIRSQRSISISFWLREDIAGGFKAQIIQNGRLEKIAP